DEHQCQTSQKRLPQRESQRSTDRITAKRGGGVFHDVYLASIPAERLESRPSLRLCRLLNLNSQMTSASVVIERRSARNPQAALVGTLRCECNPHTEQGESR